MQSYRTPTEAVRFLRSTSKYAALVRDTYLDADVIDASQRYGRSGEWAAIRRLLGTHIPSSTIVDLGAGNGMASRAFAEAGALRVIAIEPDASEEVGRGAIRRCCTGLPVEPVAGFGESLPLGDETAEIVFARQVLHHTRNLEQTLRECSRVLRSGGVFLACREHVADTPAELVRFLAGHPVHQLTGGENAYRLAEYRHAIVESGLRLEQQWGPWDSVINLFPAVTSDDEIPRLTARLLRERFGFVGTVAARAPLIVKLAEKRLRRPRPGRLYSFLATKP